jgi:hypothetical protein
MIWIGPNEKTPNFARTIGTVDLFYPARLREFRDPLRGELPHVKIFMNDVSAEIRPAVFQDKLVNLINNY